MYRAILSNGSFPIEWRGNSLQMCVSFCKWRLPKIALMESQLLFSLNDLSLRDSKPRNPKKFAGHFATPHPFRATEHLLSSKSHKPLAFARIGRRTVSSDFGGGTKEDCPIFPLTDLESRNSLCRRAIFCRQYRVVGSGGFGSNFSVPSYEIMTNQNSFLKKGGNVPWAQRAEVT